MNLKLLLLALVAMLCLGATSAYAQPGPPRDPGNNGGCTYDCGSSEDPDDDRTCDSPDCYPGPCVGVSCNPPCTAGPNCPPPCLPGVVCPPPCVGDACDDPDPCVGPGCGPDPGCVIDCGPGGKIPGNHAGLRRCDAQIGDLKKVSAQQIRSISGRDTAEVVPVCAHKNLIEQQKGVENIRTAVANNKIMDEALDEYGTSADYVVGVIVGRTQAVLYVHTP